MIPIEDLSYEIDQSLNRLSSNNQQQINIEDKLIALNKARLILVKQKVGVNNVYGLGLDGFKKRYQDLETLIVPFEKGKSKLKLANKALNKYSVTVPKDLMFYIDSYVDATKGECSDIVFTNPNLTKHEDIVKLLKNSTYKPSFEWREIPTEISGDNISHYTDGTFTLSNTYISYLRYPIEMDMEGYQHFDGTESKNVNSDLPIYLKDEILDIAVQLLSANTGNSESFQYSQALSKTNE